jgi:hypothetical protein
VRSRQAKAAEVARCLIFMGIVMFKEVLLEDRLTPSRADALGLKDV